MATTKKNAAPPKAKKGGGAGRKPNILVIWGDDIGIANLSCYMTTVPQGSS